MLAELGVDQVVDHAGQTAGLMLETAVEQYLALSLPALMPGRGIRVDRRSPITDFLQYEHLARIHELINADPTRTLRASLGGDYVIKPDVTVALFGPDGRPPPLLHAAIPCKWTLRSDRAQNVRHEAVTMIRHRRGRLPHITPVTAEPQPTRIASLARGTAEVDVVYHIALEELQRACERAGNPTQIDVLNELIDNRRLMDVADLPRELSL